MTRYEEIQAEYPSVEPKVTPSGIKYFSIIKAIPDGFWIGNIFEDGEAEGYNSYCSALIDR